MRQPSIGSLRPLDLELNKNHTTKYGDKSLRSLPNQILKETDYISSRNL